MFASDQEKQQQELKAEVTDLKETIAALQNDISSMKKQLPHQTSSSSSPSSTTASSAPSAATHSLAALSKTTPGFSRFIVPAAVMSVIAIGMIILIAGWRLSTEIHRALEDKSQILTNNLATVLGDPFAMGEYDHMQQIIESARKADPDLYYAIVLSSDGRAIATTDPSLKNARLTNSDFEKNALKATDFLRRPNPKDADVFETVMPIRALGGQAGILRMGISEKRAEYAVQSSFMLMFIVGVFISALNIAILFVLGRSLFTSNAQGAARRNS